MLFKARRLLRLWWPLLNASSLLFGPQSRISRWVLGRVCLYAGIMDMALCAEAHGFGTRDDSISCWFFSPNTPVTRTVWDHLQDTEPYAKR